jgi:excisionase family DNA binding protein
MAFRRRIEPTSRSPELALGDRMRSGGRPLPTGCRGADPPLGMPRALAILSDARGGRPGWGRARTDGHWLCPDRSLALASTQRILGEVSMGPLVALEKKQATIPSFEPLIDNLAAAELLKIHPKTLQRMARRGEVPAVRIGRYWRFRASQLDSWVQSLVNSGRRPCRTESLL